jgi:hypothetical protein
MSASRSQPSGASKNAATEAAPSAAFTPGPWEVGVEGNGTPGFIYCDNALGSAVAIVYGIDAMAHSVFPRRVEEANARLIAAAPMLFSALERINTATMASTNSATLADFQSWVRAVAATALADVTGPLGSAQGNSGRNQ